MIGTLNKVGLFNIKILKKTAISPDKFDYMFTLEDGRIGFINNSTAWHVKNNCCIVYLKCVSYDERTKYTTLELISHERQLGRF